MQLDNIKILKNIKGIFMIKLVLGLHVDRL